MPKSHEEDSAISREQRREMGRRIVEARKKAGFATAREFAAAVGVKPATLSGWEHGTYSPGWENLNRIMELTNERSSFLNPERFTGKLSLGALSRRLGTILGAARAQRLLEMPEDRLRREIDAILGAHLVSETESRSARKRKGR